MNTVHLRYRPISIHSPLKVSTNQRSVIDDSFPTCWRSFQSVWSIQGNENKVRKKMKLDDLAETSVLSYIYANGVLVQKDSLY